ncbi:hypothetical protein NP233_g4160 [Leucocoprinus birnbaumii]|uniref:Uncharacterized protein n=1 Tax=Leucocoprinus birnbaumii TaxID=56174 RepID=A0AAD5YXT6_9AGAR|nr:hypothetical protein NP233_g4160 [Leucocoprinus birnbaumii]
MAETRNTLLQALSRTQVVTLTTVEGTLYGLSFALYLTCCRLLLLELSKDKGRRRQNFFTLSHMSLIIICYLLGLAVDAKMVQVSWVDHPTAAPGGGWIYWLDVFSHTGIAGMGYVVAMLIELLTNGMQIWRFLALLGSIVIEIVVICDLIGHQIFISSQGPNLSTARQGLTILTGLIVTSLIGARIALVRRTHIQTMGKSESSNQYFSIIAMLVESFALEFIWTTISIATSFSDATGIPAVNVAVTNLVPPIQIIAYLLVVYRVSTGRAWEKDTEEKLSSLQWNPDAQRTTQMTTTHESIRISGDAPGDEV